MAVNTTEIGTLYDELMKKADATLKSEYDAKRLRGSDYASVVAGAISSAMTTSVNAVQNQPIVDEQVSSSQAKTAIDQAQSAKDLLTKDAQIAMINNQAATELKRALLVVRQTTAYDDNLKIEEAKQAANYGGMKAVGGTAITSELETTIFNLINAIKT